MKFFVAVVIYAAFFFIDFIPKYKAGKKKEYIFSGVLISLGAVLLILALADVNFWNPVVLTNIFLQEYSPF